MRSYISFWSGIFFVLASTYLLYFFFSCEQNVILIGMLLAIFMYSKLILLFFLGVKFYISKDKFQIYGFTTPILIYFIVIAIILFIFLGMTYVPDMRKDLQEITVNNLRYVTWSMIIGFISAFIVWYLNMYDEIKRCSEASLRHKIFSSRMN